MDVGLVCDACCTFNPMGARVCAKCGTALALEALAMAALEREPASGADAADSREVRVAGAAAGAGAAHLGSRSSASSGPSPSVSASRSPATTRTPTPNPAARPSGSGSVALAEPRLCSVCGVPIAPGFRFCGACGTPVEEQTRPAVRPSAMPSGGSGKKTLFFGAMQAARAKLVLIKGDGLDGVSFTLAGEEHQAGRGDVPLAFVEDPYMSPVHANFFYRKGQLVVRDESSVNGVYIRIRGAVPIELGDRFLVGEQVIEVQRSLSPDEPLAATGDGTYFYASPRPPSHFRLIQLLRGGDTGLAFQAQSDVVSLGREGNDLNFPDDPFISGHHAQVSFEGGSLSLTDLGSKNGTFLRLTRESVLEHGDYVFMGQQLLRVEIV